MKAELVDIRQYDGDVYEIFSYDDSGLKITLLDKKSLGKIADFYKGLEDDSD
jgi:hypothetical protein